jgi:glycosyltransferase involved in cell wall biosynthesis
MNASDRIVVLDANAYWTEQLFRECMRFADVLLLKPHDFRAHWKHYGTIRSDSAPRVIAKPVWEQRLSMPPGWMIELWPWTQRRLGRVIRAFTGNEPFTLVLTYPQYRRLIPALQPALSVYYNLDDYRDNWPGREHAVSSWERELVKLADNVVCISNHRASALRQQHPAKAGHIHHIPIGCTPEFLAGSAEIAKLLEKPKIRNTETQPPELRSLQAPVAGYIGALNWRFDYVLLADVAQQLPDVTFALGGKIPGKSDGNSAWREGLERARNLSNVHFLGWIDHARLGEFLNSFDLLFMMYSRCNFNTNACPAKLWDSLGTGKPIVANDANPETLLWREVIHIGETAAAFAEKLRLVLRGEPAGLRQHRLAIAQEHTWERLSHRMEEVLRVNE